MDPNLDKTYTVYIELLNEGTDVWRPAQALLVDKNIYKVLTPVDYDPDDEKWKFKPGSLVECEWKKKNGKKILIAHKLVSK